MNRKVLLINCGPSKRNFGDEAINFSLMSILKSKGCSVTCEPYTKVFDYNRSRGRSLLKNIYEMFVVARRGYEFVFIGGGQLVLGNRRFPYSLLTWTVLLRLLSRSKLVLFGVGVDSKYSKRQQWVLRKAIGLCHKVYVRDQLSNKNLLREFGLISKVIPDVACPISLFYPRKINLEKGENKTLLFGLTGFDSVKRYNTGDLTELDYFEIQAQQLIAVSKEYSKVALIYSTTSDYKDTIKFKSFLFTRHSVVVEIANYKTLFEFLDTIQSADMVISSRMHALIVAGSYNVDFTPIIRNDKIKIFQEEYVPFREPQNYLKEIELAIEDAFNSKDMRT